ncbi:MAG: DinB family protein [Anaerolineae bacterium]|nr:DinB family protein [Anaerolineae bacterium]
MNTREELRQEIMETRRRFHQLLERVPDEAFRLPSTTPEWMIGEVLYHMSLAPRFLTADIKFIVGQRWLYRLVIRLIPKWLFDGLMIRLTRYGARHLSRQFLAKAYDKAHALTLAALDAVADEDFEKSMHYPDWDPLLSGQVTLERLFHYVSAHFNWHAAQVEGALE